MDLAVRFPILKPGQKGTKRLVQQYGDQLVCVRYKYDWKRKKRIKTIELKIEEKDWKPQSTEFINNKLVFIRVQGYEQNIRKRVKKAGGIWLPRKKLWKLSYQEVIRLGLKPRIVMK